MKGPNLESFFNSETGRWTVMVPFGLPEHMMRGVIDFLLKVDKKRLLAAPAAAFDWRENLRTRIKALEDGKVDQHIVTRGDVDVFKSTERMNPERAIVDLGERRIVLPGEKPRICPTGDETVH